MTCTGCRHEWLLQDEFRCDLGEKHGIRCTKWHRPTADDLKKAEGRKNK